MFRIKSIITLIVSPPTIYSLIYIKFYLSPNFHIFINNLTNISAIAKRITNNMPGIDNKNTTLERNLPKIFLSLNKSITKFFIELRIYIYIFNIRFAAYIESYK